MLIANASKEQVEKALAMTNAHFDGNIEFKDGIHKSGKKLRCVLRAVSSREAGARRSVSGRRTVAACWHAWGVFFDSLPANAKITVANGSEVQTVSPGDPWQDPNIGTRYRPAFRSLLCDCTDF